MNELPGDYVAGFVDGEGCFALNFRRDVRHDRKGSPVYFYWDAEFVILLRADDRDILEKIQHALNCGNISVSKRNSVRYSVTNFDDLNFKIIPFFKKYPLRAKKLSDFILWKEAVDILGRNKQKKIKRLKYQRGFPKIKWKTGDIQRLKGIHKEMQEYKSRAPEWKWLPAI